MLNIWNNHLASLLNIWQMLSRLARWLFFLQEIPTNTMLYAAISTAHIVSQISSRLSRCLFLFLFLFLFLQEIPTNGLYGAMSSGGKCQVGSLDDWVLFCKRDQQTCALQCVAVCCSRSIAVSRQLQLDNVRQMSLDDFFFFAKETHKHRAFLTSWHCI